MSEKASLPVGWSYCTFGSFLTPTNRPVSVTDENEYQLCGVRWYGNGAFIRETKQGSEIKIKGKNMIKEGDVIYNKLFAWKGSFAIVQKDLDGCCVSDEFPIFQIDSSVILPQYLEYFFLTDQIRQQSADQSRGVSAASRFRLHERDFLKLEIPLPSLEDQRRIVEKIKAVYLKMNEINTLQESTKVRIIDAINSLISSVVEGCDRKELKEVAPLIRRPIKIDPEREYPELGIRSFGKGTFHKPPIRGSELNGKRLFRIEPGDLLFSNVFAWKGAVAVAKPEDAGRYGSHRFISRRPIEGVASADFLFYYFTTPEGVEQLGKASPGSAGRNRTLGLKMLDEIEVPLPCYDKQMWVVSLAKRLEAIRERQSDLNKEIEGLFKSLLDRAFQGNVEEAISPL